LGYATWGEIRVALWAVNRRLTTRDSGRKKSVLGGGSLDRAAPETTGDA
jgi:hypothetical protein